MSWLAGRLHKRNCAGARRSLAGCLTMHALLLLLLLLPIATELAPDDSQQSSGTQALPAAGDRGGDEEFSSKAQ